MPAPDRSNALDHIVVVLFENRSLDNVLGHLYGPADGKNVDGVIGKDLTNPIPGWAERGADRKVVPHTVATDMDSPNPDSGEEYFHTNTQLFNIIDDHNRFKIGEAAAAPWNAPPPGTVPTMDGFVTDYISTFTGETGRQPVYDEYAHIMTGCTPRQLPVLFIRFGQPARDRRGQQDAHVGLALESRPGGHVVMCPGGGAGGRRQGRRRRGSVRRGGSRTGRRFR